MSMAVPAAAAAAAAARRPPAPRAGPAPHPTASSGCCPAARGQPRSRGAAGPAPPACAAGAHSQQRPASPARPLESTPGIGLVWFRAGAAGGLRLDDCEPLAAAAARHAAVLPVFVADPRALADARSTGPFAAAFVLQAVADLRRRLRAAGADLVVRVGSPEVVLPALVRRVRAAAVYCSLAAGGPRGERAAERRARAACEAAGAAWRPAWAGTLLARRDVPPGALPPDFLSFLGCVDAERARAPLPAPTRIAGFSAARLPPGELPTLRSLGVAPLPRRGRGELPRGGETEALRRLRGFLDGLAARGAAAARHSFETCLAPWLEAGCLSPRRVLAEAAARARGRRAGAMAWVRGELLWRDFRRFAASGV